MSTILHQTVVFDFDEDVIEAPVLASPKRKRGRPPGAKGKVTHPPVTVDDIAFLRAVLQGIDHRVAAGHYLGHLGAPLERRGAGLYPEILRKRLVATAHNLADAREYIELLWPPGKPSPFAPRYALEPNTADAAGKVAAPEGELPPRNALFSWELAQPPAVASTAAPPKNSRPPSLEEFAARFDADMFSEAELIDLYEDEFGKLPIVQAVELSPAAAVTATASIAPDDHWMQQHLAPPPAMQGNEDDAPTESVRAAVQLMQQRLHALSWIGDRLAVAPKREDPMHQWLPITMAQILAYQEQGVLTLGNLIDWIAVTGRRWYTRIPRFGRERARRLENWIWYSGMRAAPGLRTPGEDLAAMRAGFGGAHLTTAVAGPGALVPLAQFKWPVEHRGAVGGFRGGSTNTLEAHDDIAAVRAWFGTLSDHSPQTQRAYQGAIERLVLWAATERRKAVSALSTLDLQAFREFLETPPAHWIQTAPRLKSAHDWRPLRGPLKGASLLLSQAAIRAMYKAWHKSGYIVSDPSALLPGPRRKDAKLDVGRSFSEQDRQLIRERLQAMPDSPRKRRLVAILVMLQTSGMRLAELAEASWANIERQRVDDALTENRAIRFIGKGLRERVVPLQDAVIALLDQHRSDRLALMEQGKLVLSNPGLPQTMPLIGILDDRFAWSKPAQPDGQMPHQSARPINEDGRLSATRLYALLKDFFGDCAKHSGADHSDFKKASTHWLRHTFAHQALKAAGGDLVVVKDLLGHADIATTTIYTKSDLSTRSGVVQGIEPFL